MYKAHLLSYESDQGKVFANPNNGFNSESQVLDDV